MRYALLFLVSIALATPASTQNRRPVTYSTEQGLSENVVYSLLQDKEGFIWAGTHHGLNRFDGYSWKNFYQSNSDSLSLPSNVIYDIEEDDKFLWLSSDKGVVRFSKKTFHSSLITPSEPAKSGYQMERMNDSLIAVSYMDKVGLLNTKTQRITILKTGKPNNIINIGFNKFFQYGNPGNTYFSTETEAQKQLYRINTESLSITEVNQADLFPFKPLGPVQDYFLDHLKHHWAFYDDLGWRVYDHTGRPDEIKLTFLPTTISTSAYVRDNENVWLASNSGVICYNMNSRTSAIFDNREQKLLVNKVYSLIRDRNQNIWAGTFGGGLTKLSTSKTNPIYGFYNNPDMLMGNMVTGLRKMRSGDLLLYDFSNYEIRDPKFKKIESGTLKNDSFQLKRLGLDMNEQEISSLRKPLNKVLNLNSVPFFYIRTDSFGRIYHGSDAVDINGNVILKSNGNFTRIITDKWGSTWVTGTSGLYKILPDNIVKKISFPKIQKTPDLVFVDAHITGDSTLWLATQDGLISMKITDMVYSRYTVDSGLPDNYIYQIQPDKAGNLWLSTNKGLSCFNPKEKTFRNFGKRYGLINSEYNSYSSCELNDTTLVFGGTAGIDFINPESMLALSKQAPGILLTGIRINNRDTIVENNMIVPHQMNNWEFNFTTNDMDFPQDIYFRYRLTGAYEDWNYLQGTNKVLFTFLKPGNYTFEVQSSFNKNEWSRSGSIYFRITETFFQTWWFILLCLAIISSAFYLLLKYRLQQKLNMLHMRNRISRDLHDEVGSSLSGIRIFSQMAEEKIDSDPTITRIYLQKVQNYCESVLSSMNDIVWTINPDNDRFIKIYRKLHSYAASVAEPHNVKLKFSESGLLNDQKLNMEVRKNIYLIAKEAINNAIKYSECKNLSVDIKKIKDRLVLVISDDGKGFDPATAVNGNGLRNISERAQEMNAELDFKTSCNGTTVKVSLKIP